MKNGNMPAMAIEFSGFGQYAPEAHAGLTKREMFSMHAMQGIIGNIDHMKSLNRNGVLPSEWCAKMSVSVADALLAELEKQENNQ